MCAILGFSLSDALYKNSQFMSAAFGANVILVSNECENPRDTLTSLATDALTTVKKGIESPIDKHRFWFYYNNGRFSEKTKLYATIVDIGDDLSRISDGGFDEEEYYQHPELYQSNFAKKVAPYASCIVNGVYWQPGQPRLLTNADAKTLLARDPNAPEDLTDIGEDPILPRRLLAICDISADEDGSIQWTKYCTTADVPFCIYNQAGQIIKTGMTDDGVLMCSVDNMPAQFPKDATDYFGELYLPYLKELLKTDANSTFEEYQKAVCPALENAVIATNGKLAAKYQYIADLRIRSTGQNH